jgi:hypothetical protein
MILLSKIIQEGTPPVKRAKSLGQFSLTFHRPDVIISKRIERRSRLQESAARPLPTKVAFQDFCTRLEAAL